MKMPEPLEDKFRKKKKSILRQEMNLYLTANKCW